MIFTKIFNALLAVIIFVPFPNAITNSGMYNVYSRIYWCITEYSCLHEYSHWLDQEQSWISQDEDFQNTFKVYLLTSDKSLHKLIGESWREIYADFYAIHNGNVPEEFKVFYPDLQTVSKCLEIYELKICQEVK